MVKVGVLDGTLLVVEVFCYVIFEGVNSPTTLSALTDIVKTFAFTFYLVKPEFGIRIES